MSKTPTATTPTNTQDKLNSLRKQSQYRLKMAWEDICSRYSNSFDAVSDEIDLATGKIVVDKGFVRTTPVKIFGAAFDDSILPPLDADKPDSDVNDDSEQENVHSPCVKENRIPSLYSLTDVNLKFARGVQDSSLYQEQQPKRENKKELYSSNSSSRQEVKNRENILDYNKTARDRNAEFEYKPFKRIQKVYSLQSDPLEYNSSQSLCQSHRMTHSYKPMLQKQPLREYKIVQNSMEKRGKNPIYYQPSVSTFTVPPRDSPRDVRRCDYPNYPNYDEYDWTVNQGNPRQPKRYSREQSIRQQQREPRVGEPRIVSYRQMYIPSHTIPSHQTPIDKTCNTRPKPRAWTDIPKFKYPKQELQEDQDSLLEYDDDAFDSILGPCIPLPKSIPQKRLVRPSFMSLDQIKSDSCHSTPMVSCIELDLQTCMDPLTTPIKKLTQDSRTSLGKKRRQEVPLSVNKKLKTTKAHAPSPLSKQVMREKPSPPPDESHVLTLVEPCKEPCLLESNILVQDKEPVSTLEIKDIDTTHETVLETKCTDLVDSILASAILDLGLEICPGTESYKRQDTLQADTKPADPTHSKTSWWDIYNDSKVEIESSIHSGLYCPDSDY